WLVRYDEEFGVLENDTGMRYLARLLSNPNSDQEALSLVSCHNPKSAAGSVRSQSELDGREGVVSLNDSLLLVLDPQGLREAHEEMRGIADKLEKAREANDDNEVHRLERQYEKLKTELKKATGLGGKSRRLGPAGNAEKARHAISKALSRVYAKMSKA